MTPTIYSGDNKLNLSLKLTSFSVSSSIPSILLQYVIRKVCHDGKVNLDYEAWEVKTGRYSPNFNPLCRNSFSLTSLAQLNHMKYGTKFMNTSICRQKHILVNFTLTFSPPLLTTKRYASSSLR